MEYLREKSAKGLEQLSHNTARDNNTHLGWCLYQYLTWLAIIAWVLLISAEGHSVDSELLWRSGASSICQFFIDNNAHLLQPTAAMFMVASIGAWGWRKIFSMSFLGWFIIPSQHMYHTLLELHFAMIYPLKQFYLELLNYVVVTWTSFVLEITVWFWTITWKPRIEVLFIIIVHIIYVKCTTINCRLTLHEIRHHKYPFYFTNKDACSKWISHKSRVLVELWNELFETSTNSVSSSKFIVNTSHETVKSNLFYRKSGIYSCQVSHH